MNIFVLDENPALAAYYHCDIHVNKMILESCQLLSNAHWLFNGRGPYKLTHQNHPCSMWTRLSVNNYKWLSELTTELMGVYFNTRGKFHGCSEIYYDVLQYQPPMPEIEMTPHPICMPDQFKINDDVVVSYRNYYCYKQSMFKRHKMTWKYRQIPSWYEPKLLA